MKVLPFTIPVADDRTIIVQDEVLPHFYTHLHRHEEVQLTWILEGEGTLLTGNTMHHFRPQEIYLLGTNLPHLFKSDPAYFAPGSGIHIHTITIFFNPNGKLLSLFSLPEMKTVQGFLSRFQGGFKVPSRLVKDVSDRMMGIKDFGGIDQLIQLMQLLKVFTSINGMQPLSAVNYPQSISDPEGMRIGSIYNYIMQNYGNPLSLEDVADQAHMTPNAFCRYFKKHTRHTFVHFLNKVRVNESCKILLNGTYNGIAAVAYNCGFKSITNFNRVFKDITGQSPRGYIDSYSNTMN